MMKRVRVESSPGDDLHVVCVGFNAGKLSRLAVPLGIKTAGLQFDLTIAFRESCPVPQAGIELRTGGCG